ncbi:uncharacterized protein LOC120344178 [Styela clava]
MRLAFLLLLTCTQGILPGNCQTDTTPQSNSSTTDPLCNFGEYNCGNGKCLSQIKVCDGIDSCGDYSDERGCRKKRPECWSWQEFCDNGDCINGTYQCKNGKCISTKYACDKIDHCGDGSDEIRHVAGFKCPLGQGGDICVLPQRHVSDCFTHCNNEEDEGKTTDGHSRLFHCFDKSMRISTLQQCDGVVDCSDLSDECPCENRNEEFCSRYCTREAEWGTTNCTLGTFVCDITTELTTDKICDGRLDCKDRMDEKYCSSHSSRRIMRCAGDVDNSTRTLARLCDGRPECYDLSDECNLECVNKTNTTSDFCYLGFSTVPFIRECNTSTGTFNLTVEHICDGQWSSCNPRIPEEETNCPGRFYCQSGSLISIDNVLKCNGYEDCDDGSDEDNCTSRYQCEEGTPLSVPNRFVGDGVQDCHEGADECPRDLDNEPIGSRAYLIASPFFQFWVWFVGFCCIFGNSYMIIDKIRDYDRIHKAEGLLKCNHLILFNLAIADLLMAIYLLGIAVKNSTVAGAYCRHDVQWRTSNACVWLGAISIISSEASVFMLTLLTTIRLVSVHNPLTVRSIKVKWAAIAIALAWGIALFIGLIPFSSHMQEAFTYGAFIPSKFISSRTVHLNGVRQFATLLTAFSPNASNTNLPKDWSKLNYHLQQNFPAHRIRGFYGYYSQESVCLPNFYVTTKEMMWGYSFTIVIVNFFIFIYIMLAYIAIYRKSNKKSKIRSTADRSSSMQKKIIRLVASDFCCWMPLCIIALLNFTGAIKARAEIYAATAIIILPINSVLNPLMYSNIVDVVWKKRVRLQSMLVSSKGTEITNK